MAGDRKVLTVERSKSTQSAEEHESFPDSMAPAGNPF